MRAKDVFRQVATVISVPFGILMNFMPIGGKTVATEVEHGGPIAVDAAAYAFSIWGLIFAWTLAFAAYQALPTQRENPVLRKVGLWPALNAASWGLWALAVVQHQFLVGWALIVVMLVSLIVVEAKLGVGAGGLGAADRWLVQVPLRINLGWVSVATILSTASVLRNDLGWRGGAISEPIWGAIVVLSAALLGLAMLILRRNVAFALVITWALVAVALGSTAIPLVTPMAAASAVLVMGALLLSAKVLREQPLRV